MVRALPIRVPSHLRAAQPSHCAGRRCGMLAWTRHSWPSWRAGSEMIHLPRFHLPGGWLCRILLPRSRSVQPRDHLAIRPITRLGRRGRRGRDGTKHPCCANGRGVGSGGGIGRIRRVKLRMELSLGKAPPWIPRPTLSRHSRKGGELGRELEHVGGRVRH